MPIMHIRTCLLVNTEKHLIRNGVPTDELSAVRRRQSLVYFHTLLAANVSDVMHAPIAISTFPILPISHLLTPVMGFFF